MQECKYKPRKSFADAEADWVDLVKSRVEIFGNYHVVDQRSMWEIKIVILIRQVPSIQTIIFHFMHSIPEVLKKNWIRLHSFFVSGFVLSTGAAALRDQHRGGARGHRFG